jgi:hypothetical protein
MALYRTHRPEDDLGMAAIVRMAERYHDHYTRENNIADLLSGNILSNDQFHGLWKYIMANFQKRERAMMSAARPEDKPDVRFFFRTFKEQFIGMLTNIVVEIRTSQREWDAGTSQHIKATQLITTLNTRINSLV